MPIAAAGLRCRPVFGAPAQPLPPALGRAGLLAPALRFDFRHAVAAAQHQAALLDGGL